MAKSKRRLDPEKKSNVRAASLANLRPAKKGDIRNPAGGHTHNPLTRALTNMSKEAYCKALSVAFQGRQEDLETLINDPDTPMLEKFVAQSLLHAFENNDFSFVERIADRLIGKVGETMNITQNNTSSITNQFALVSDQDLKMRLAKIREDV